MLYSFGNSLPVKVLFRVFIVRERSILAALSVKSSLLTGVSAKAETLCRFWCFYCTEAPPNKPNSVSWLSVIKPTSQKNYAVVGLVTNNSVRLNETLKKWQVLVKPNTSGVVGHKTNNGINILLYLLCIAIDNTNNG